MNQSVRIHITFLDDDFVVIIVPMRIGGNYVTFQRAAFENGFLFSQDWLTVDGADGIFYAIPIRQIKSITCAVIS